MIRLPLDTKRLRIRPFTPDDAKELHELWGDDDGMRFIPPGATASVDATRERLLSTIERSSDGWGFWALEERDGGRLVGGAGLFPLGWEGPEIELAYHVVPSRWRRGYATEAGGALLAAAWAAGLDQVVAVALPENRASTRVMEKLGMRLEGRHEYRGFEVVRHAIDRAA